MMSHETIYQGGLLKRDPGVVPVIGSQDMTVVARHSANHRDVYVAVVAALLRFANMLHPARVLDGPGGLSPFGGASQGRLDVNLLAEEIQWLLIPTFLSEAVVTCSAPVAIMAASPRQCSPLRHKFDISIGSSIRSSIPRVDIGRGGRICRVRVIDMMSQETLFQGGFLKCDPGVVPVMGSPVSTVVA